MNFGALTKLFVLLSFFSIASSEERPIVVIVTSYNNQRYVKKNLGSIFSQEYSNYRVIYVDDCSADGTGRIVKRLCEGGPDDTRFIYIRNKMRVGALANIYHAVHSCKDNEIVVSLDGDDWFAHPGVLRRINEAYARSDVWLTHGTLIEYPSGATAWSMPIPQEAVASGNLRTCRAPSHLRTFYAWLFKQIRVEDLQYGGAFFPMSWDLAMMLPMLEMAEERHCFIPEVLYVYNVENALNDNKVNPQLQRELEAYIRAMPRYPRLDKNPHLVRTN